MFWSKYCALCVSNGKAPNVVASEIGIKSSGTVTGWKNGSIPRLSILHKLSDYFGVPIEYWNDESEQKEIPATQIGSEDEATQELFDLFKYATPDERKEIINFANYVRNKRKEV